MPRITDYSIVETYEYPIIYITKEINVSDLHDFIDKSFIELLSIVNKGAVEAIDLPFIHILNSNNEIINVIAGISIKDSIKDTEHIKCAILPGGKNIVTYFKGNENELKGFYQEIFQYAKSENYRVATNPYEYYLNDKRYGTDLLITKLVVPIK